MQTADIVVVLVDAAQLGGSNADEEVASVLQESGAFEGGDAGDLRILAVVNKIDTHPVPEQRSITVGRSGEKIPLVAVSCKTEQGLPAFVDALTQFASSMQALYFSSAPSFSLTHDLFQLLRRRVQRLTDVFSCPTAQVSRRSPE